jgi:hypothetical protein
MHVVAAGPHLVEPERLEQHGLWPTPRHRVHAHLRVDRAFELPDQGAAIVLDQLRSPLPQGQRQPGGEQVRWLDHVVVHRDHGGANLRSRGLRQEQRGVERRRHLVPFTQLVRTDYLSTNEADKELIW